jgi:hypothetical protein
VHVPYDEGIANRIGPESCAVAREGFGEALTGECTDQPLSRERFLSRVPTPCIRRKATRQGASSRAPGRPGVVRDPGMSRHSLRGNREISRSTVWQLELPGVAEDGMSGKNGQRKPGTAHGSPRRSRTAKASHISRPAVASGADEVD